MPSYLAEAGFYVALLAAKSSIAGLEFFSGIPGTIGGALRMNAGAYGGETKDVLIAADVTWDVTRFVRSRGTVPEKGADKKGGSSRGGQGPCRWWRAP